MRDYCTDCGTTYDERGLCACTEPDWLRSERDRLLSALVLEQGLRHTFEEAAARLEVERDLLAGHRDLLRIQVDRLKSTLQAEVNRLEADILRERERSKKFKRLLLQMIEPKNGILRKTMRCALYCGVKAKDLDDILR